jgi:spore coat protein H
MTRTFGLVCVLVGTACSAAPTDDGPPRDEETPPCEPGECEIDGLDSAVGCGGVYNPDQLLDYHLTMSAGDWSSLRSDATFETYYPARFACNDEPELGFEVAVRRKRSGSTDKPGLKVDFNKLTPGASYYSLKKLSLENGVSSGSDTAEPKDALAEYTAWRMMARSGAVTSRAAFARVFVNGELIGVYVNVEQLDKRFLRSRGIDDEGWLFKLSGGVDDGYKTNETTPNPYEERLCFFDKNPCAAPSAEELATYLPEHLDIEQMLLFGGVNALVANSDAPFYKDNNFYWYDDPAGAPRVFLPWDLDTTMHDTASIFGGTGSTLYTSVLFTHWEDDYDQLLTDLLAGPLAEAEIMAELDRAGDVAGAALDADPTFVGDASAAVVDELKSWWTARHAQVSAELAAH